MGAVYHNGCVTVTFLSKEEAEQYRNMPVGITIESDIIRWVAENEEEIQILEQTASGINRIRIKKEW